MAKLKQIAVKTNPTINKWRAIALIGSVQMLQPFSIDPYLPSSRVIAGDFGVEISLIQLTISSLAIGFGVGQLIAGPLSDALGRRRPLLIAMLVYVLATIFVSFAPNLPTFFAFRVAQGLGASAVLVVGNAMIRDLFEGSLLVKAFSRAMLLQAASWVIGPFGGALLLTVTNWRGISVTIAGVATFLLVLAWRYLPDTLHHDNRSERIFKGMLGRFRAVLRDREYTALVGVSMGFQLAIYAYLTVITIVYTRQWGVAAGVVGIFMGINSMASYVGVQFSAKLSQYIDPRKVLTGVIIMGLVMSAVMVLISGYQPPLWLGVTVVLLFVFAFGASITPNMTLAMAPHGHEAGTAAALLGVASYLGSGAAGPFFTTLTKENLSGAGGTIFALMAISLLLMLTVVKANRKRSL